MLRSTVRLSSRQSLVTRFVLMRWTAFFPVKLAAFHYSSADFISVDESRLMHVNNTCGSHSTHASRSGAYYHYYKGKTQVVADASPEDVDCTKCIAK